MKKVIEGKLYDTDASLHICKLPCDTTNSGDFAWHETSLYRSKGGRFFIAGHGGPRSQWREQVEQNSWFGGSGLLPVSQEEARGLMEEANCSLDQFADVGLKVESA